MSPSMLIAVQYIIVPVSLFSNVVISVLSTSNNDETNVSFDEVSGTKVSFLYQKMFAFGLQPLAVQRNVNSFRTSTATVLIGDKMTSETGTMNENNKNQLKIIALKKLV